MKKILLIIISFILVSLAYSQEKAIRVKYEMEFKLDSTNLDKKEADIMFLDIISGKYSFFQSKQTFLKDSILASENPQALLGIAKPKFNYSVKKNHGSESQRIFYDYTAYKYVVNDDVNLDWEVNNDTVKVILNQKCKLATTSFRGRKYFAWFSPSTQVSDGPYKFQGLPGLILEVHDENNHYNFRAFSIETIDNYNSYLNENEFTNISISDLKKFQDKVKEKPSIILMNSGIRLPKKGLDKYDRNQRKRNERNNNPIELL